MQGSSHYDGKFAHLTPEQKDVQMLDKTFPHFFVGGDPSQRSIPGVVSISPINVLDTSNMSEEDVPANKSHLNLDKA
jgi:hypothetical protein